MDKLEVIRILVAGILKKKQDHLTDPVSSKIISDEKYGKAFALGVEQGCHDTAFAIAAILEKKDD